MSKYSKHKFVYKIRISKSIIVFLFSREIPDLLDIPEINEIAKRHGKTPGQILLKWIVENGVAAIPKSVNTNRLRQNKDLFDFSLTKEDLDVISSLDKNIRVCDFSFFQGWVLF